MDPLGGGGPSSGTSAEVDPLTAMVMQQEAQQKRLEKLELKYRRERAMRKRGIQIEGEDGKNDRFDTYSVRSMKGVQAHRKRLTWPRC